VQSLESGKQIALFAGWACASMFRLEHLVYAVENRLFAVPFDYSTLKVTGGQIPLIEGGFSCFFPFWPTHSAVFGIGNADLLDWKNTF